MRHLLAIAFCAVVPILSHAQDKKDAKPGDAMIEKYLAAEADRLSAKFMDGAKTLDDWQAKRPRLYQEYMDMLGLWPIPEKTPLKATVTGTLEAHGVVVEKLHFQSKPGLYVTANVYRPHNKESRKLPAIVYVCGHSGKGRDGCKTAFQDHGFWFANNGYVCIILDTLQLGEIPGVHHGTYGRPWGHLTSWGVKDAEKMKNHNRFWWHDLGYSPAAVECWNGIRAIDYLCTRSDVNPDKIGVTGISGGGAATFWIAAADERVKVAVPVSGMSDLEFYIKQKGVNGHCDCMFLHNTYQWDWTMIAALVAPRPMLFANSDKDPIFPMDANRRIIAKLKTAYGLYGKESLVEEYVSVGGHDYRPDLRIAIFNFFNKRLKEEPTTKTEDSAKYTPVKGRELRVFPEDKDLPKDAINHRIDEVFIPAAKVTLPEKGKFAEWKKEMVAKLRKQSFRSMPDDKLIITDFVFPTSMNTFGGMQVEGKYRVMQAHMVVETNKNRGPNEILIVMDESIDGFGEAGYPRAPKWAVPYSDASHANAVFLRGVDPYTAWTRTSPPNNVVRSHVLLGRTVDQGRVWDVIACLRQRSPTVLPLFPNKEKVDLKESAKRQFEKVKIVARGDASVIAAYAAMFEPSIKELVIINPPKSHKDGPHFLNVMRVLDIPEALGLLAPTPLTIVGGNDPAFDRTAEIYRLAGAADKLKRK